MLPSLFAERINQEGRILGPLPAVTAPTLFNTPEADAIVSAMQIMPLTNPWNEDISRRPLLSNSAAMIAQIKSDLSPSRQTLRPFYEMNYVLVPDNQPRVSIPFFNYPDESDLDGGIFPNGSYPIPSNLPIETWPRDTGNLTLAAMAAGCEQRRRRSPRHHRRAGRRVHLGNVAGEAHRQRLGGVEWCEVQSEFERAAPGWLDIRRRRGFADVSGAGPLR